jgi:hypothetical protein
MHPPNIYPHTRILIQVRKYFKVHLISRHQDQLNTFASSLHAPGSGVDGPSFIQCSLESHSEHT